MFTTGLHYYRARYYDPQTGRFLSQDPIGFDAGDANLYRYVGNGPTGPTDPSGLQKFGEGTVFEVRYTNDESLEHLEGSLVNRWFGWLPWMRSVELDSAANACGRGRHLEDPNPGLRAGGTPLTSEGTRGLMAAMASAPVVIASIGLPGPEDLLWEAVITPATGIVTGIRNGRRVLIRNGEVIEGAAERRVAREIEGLLQQARKRPLRYKLGPNDVDLRGTGATVSDALDDAFAKTGQTRSEFEVTKWGRDKWGKSHPVEWRHKCGAEVNIDWPHANNGPDAPHVGWQTGGKRGVGGAVRGHTILDEVPFNRP